MGVGSEPSVASTEFAGEGVRRVEAASPELISDVEGDG